MKKSKLTIIAASIVMSASAIASERVNFANPYELYTGASVGYGTNGAHLSAQFDTQMSQNWALLGKYNTEESFDNHNIALSVISMSGLGFTLAYDYDKNYKNENLKAKSTEISAHYMFGNNIGFSFIPELSVGSMTHNEMSNRAYYSDLTLNAIYNTSSGLWASVAPTYSYSYNDLKTNQGNESLRGWDVKASLGYTFKNNHSLAYEYKREHGDNLSLVKYSFGF
ncbi:hypothetical protein [Vibrio hangzhouensis]|uniref:Outer membrane protein beta-barrel domain-containing protein n=1 Tax=Vibrio hangzhouensis TaxID=462991 RepID=A0A1H5X2K2_9VIBR|nr:hypothetical protein [Vibrio hangzhouensis]SEG05595.1 hypothetical protein SAMN04488244_106166 [Vibrio hangzhouensis]